MCTIAGIVSVFLRNIRRVDLDGTSMSSSGGLVMPSFFFLEAQDIFSNVRQDAADSTRRFRETGRFEEIYSGIERSQEAALQRSVEALRERFPKSATREVVFGALRMAVQSSTRLAADIYDFALRLQRIGQLGNAADGADVLSELWMLDEARCSVSGRRPGEGRRPWVDPNAEILLDQQAAAVRRTVADIAQRPLFARVAPEILARPTYLALVRLFDVFQPRAGCGGVSPTGCEDYSAEEQDRIEVFLTEVTRTSVMRRAFRHVQQLGPPGIEGEWKQVLRKIWFERRGGRPCVFEHVFLGNLVEDGSGQPIAGGLHCWLKFYLEEARGTANYLGYIYNCPEAGLRDSRFVSGKFVWDYEGYRLVKDQGGFFVGTSPEWQLACGTVAYFEVLTPERAQRQGWEPWLAARGTGYTKDIEHDGFRYRHIVCIAEGDGEAPPLLCTCYATFLGAATVAADSETLELDRVRTPAELAADLPTWLVTEGIALREDSELSLACARFVVSRSCKSLREALQEVRAAFYFDLEDAVAAANAEGFPRIRALVVDTGEVSTLFLEAIAQQQRKEAPLSAALPGLLEELRHRGRRGPRLHQPLRLLLTGRADGAPVADICRLLELAEKEGGDESGVKLRDRISLVRALFAGGSAITSKGEEVSDCEPLAVGGSKVYELS